MDPEKEFQLIQKSMLGDPQAFRLLVETYQGLAYSIAFRFTREEQESEDIVQEAFVKVWKNLSRYDKQFSFKTWLAKIVTNLCLDFLKSGRRKKMIREHQVKMTEPSVDESKIEMDELKAIVAELASRLTEKQRAVFILRDLEQFTPDEVCAALNMSFGNVKSNLYYARIKIKDGLQKFYSIETKEK